MGRDSKLDSRSRTAVPFELTYQLCSFTCVVRSGDAILGKLVDRFLRPFEAPSQPRPADRTYVLSADPSGAISLVVDGDERVRGGSAFDAVGQLLWEVSQQAIALGSEHLALHAGALSWRGTGVVLPAPSGSGKSTLTAGLTVAGCEYLSDEVALVDLESGILHPFPRALGLSQRSIGFIPGLLERLPQELAPPDGAERHVPPDALRASAIGGPCELRCVIVPEHVPGATTTLEPARRSEAVLAMMGNAFNFAEFKGAGLVALAAIAQHISAYRLRIGELSAAVDLVMDALARESETGSISRTK
jgi:hypothetical protein